MARHYGIARVATAFALAAGLAWVTPLAARAATVTGLESGVPKGNTVEVLSVDGQEGERIYLRVSEGGTVIADHLAYTLGEGSKEENEEGATSFIVSLDIPEYTSTKTYTIQAFSTRAEGEGSLLYTGTLESVYAQLAGFDHPIVVGVRTVSDSERAFIAPSTLQSGNASFDLDSTEPVSTNPLTFGYTQSASDPATYKGTISYVNDEGDVVATDTVTLDRGTKDREVAIPDTVMGSDGTYYATVNARRSVFMSYPGICDFTVRVKPTEAVSSRVTDDQIFRAHFRFVDEDGKLLATDYLSVNQIYLYTPPTSLSLGAGDQVRDFAIDSKATAKMAAQQKADFNGDYNYFKLDPTVERSDDTYTVVYKDVSSSQQTYTINLIKCATKKGEKASVYKTETILVTPDDPTKTFEVPDSIEGGYVPANNVKADDGSWTHTKEYSFTYGSDQSRAINVYYVPEDYTPEEKYEITINYVNIATREVITSETHTVSHDAVADVNFPTPETFSYDGVDYVRLAGQETGVTHGYYTGYRTYTVYYRDVNDKLNENTVITRIHTSFIPGTTIYTDDGTTITDGGTTTTDDGTTVAGTTAAGAASAAADAAGAAGADATATIGDDGTLRTIGDGTDATIVDGTGDDASTVRINDNATPLANAPTKNAGLVGLAQTPTGQAGIIGLVAVVCALLLFLFYKRRRKDDDDAADTSANGEGR